MSWSVEFYNNGVMESIYDWPPKIHTKYLKIVDLIEEFGPYDVGMPHVKALGQGLFEIRAKAEEGIVLAKKRMKEVKENG